MRLGRTGPSALRARPLKARLISCGLRKAHDQASADAEFHSWIQQNPLPGVVPAAEVGGTVGERQPEKHEQSGQPFRSTRFSWQEAPSIAARCLQRPQLQWRMQRARGVLEATYPCSSGGSGGGSGEDRVQLRLQLPRVVAGLYSELREPCRLSNSPLTRVSTEEEHADALALLHSLARHHGGQPGGQWCPSGGLRPTGNCTSGALEGLHVGQEGRPPPLLQIGSQLVVLLSADSAALGLFEEGALVEHKVLTGYTVRRKQGKAQLTYERQGGGAHSTGGSIRAREARRLFQRAAEKLAAWAPLIAACNQLYRGGTVRAWNELYASRAPAVLVDRGDERWQDVGIGMRRPRLQDLERVGAVLMHGMLEELEEEGIS